MTYKDRFTFNFHIPTRIVLGWLSSGQRDGRPGRKSAGGQDGTLKTAPW
jgi:hypothetical protein